LYLRNEEGGVSKSGEGSTQVDWKPVVGRSLGLLCLHAEELRGAPLVEQWLLLERLGFEREDAARILNTTAETLRVAASRRRTQGPNRAAAAKSAAAKKTAAGKIRQ
jgi:hypothetical protein